MSSEDINCDVCQVPETVDHYLFHCRKYDKDRRELEDRTERLLYRFGIEKSVINVGVLAGEVEDITDEAKRELVISLTEFISNTKRFSQ